MVASSKISVVHHYASNTFRVFPIVLPRDSEAIRTLPQVELQIKVVLKSIMKLGVNPGSSSASIGARPNTTWNSGLRLRLLWMQSSTSSQRQILVAIGSQRYLPHPAQQFPNVGLPEKSVRSTRLLTKNH